MCLKEHGLLPSSESRNLFFSWKSNLFVLHFVSCVCAWILLLSDSRRSACIQLLITDLIQLFVFSNLIAISA